MDNKSTDLRCVTGCSVYSVPDIGILLDPGKHTHLEAIQLSDFTLSPQSMFKILCDLHKWSHLKKFCLYLSTNRPYKDKKLRTVSDADLPGNSELLLSLTHFMLNSFCNITPVLPLIAHTLSVATNLRNLYLDHNIITMESTTYDVKVQSLSPDSDRVSNQDHNNDNYHGHFTRDIFGSVSNTIEELSLYGCRMNRVSLRCLCNSLCQWTQLVKLNLNCNDLSQVGHLLIKSIPVSIQELKLCNCRLNGETVTILAQCLASWKCLRCLSLTNNTLSGKISFIVQSLPKSIMDLSLRYCGLTSDDMCAFAKKLPYLSRLEEVDLSENPQTDMRVWDIFIESFTQCHSDFLEVDLYGCGVDEEVKMKLEQQTKSSNVYVKW